MEEIKKAKLKDLIQDDRNLNKGTERGQQLIEKSLRELGAGRSLLLDKNNRIIAGNKTHKNAEALGMEDVIIVETDGTKLVAVKRTDIDLDSQKGRKMAMADNVTTQVDLAWDTDELDAVAEDYDIDLEEWDMADADEQYEPYTPPTGGGYSLPPELDGVDVTHDKLPEVSGDDETARKRILIVYKPEEEEQLAALLGLAKIDKVVYDFEKELSGK